MAAIPDLILYSPNILVTQTSSSLGLGDSQSFGKMYGLVQQVFQTCDRCAVGDTVLFDPLKSTKIIYGSTIYFLTEQSNSSFSENPA